MVASAVAGVVDLRHFERRGAFVEDVGHLLHGSGVLRVGRVPAAEGSGVAELLRGLGCQAQREQSCDALEQHDEWISLYTML